MGTPQAYGRKLAREANRSAKWRGHRMGVWAYHTARDGGAVLGSATCKDCGRMAFITTHPAPNDIDISGEAVALGCISKAAL